MDKIYRLLMKVAVANLWQTSTL